MSLISEALADKRAQKKLENRLKLEAVEAAKASMGFEARLQDDMKTIKALFADPGVKRVVCNVNDVDLANITRAVYGNRMAEFGASIDGNKVIFTAETIEV